MEIIKAADLKEAAGAGGYTYMGGGTDMMPLLKNGVRTDDKIMLVASLPELKGIRVTDDSVIIGAGETLTDISLDANVRETVPAVAEAAGKTASPQIRNIATIGGNIMQDRRCIFFNQSELWRSTLTGCYKTGGDVCQQIPGSPVCRAVYYSDVATALIMYDSVAHYYENGKAQSRPVSELVHRHCEANGLSCGMQLPVLITGFEIPRPPADEKSAFYKYSVRSSIDFPLINFAVRFGSAEREPKLIAGAVSTEPLELSGTAALLNDEGMSNDDITESCRAELGQKAKIIKEDLISPVRKRDMFGLIYMLLKECGR